MAFDRRFASVPLGFVSAPFWKNDGHGRRITIMVFGVHVAKIHIHPWTPRMGEQTKSRELHVFGILVAKGLSNGF